MFSILKLIHYLFKSGINLTNPNLNFFRHAPRHIKYFASILISCFWCLSFGVFFGELLFIGYNMIGHIMIVSMIFITWVLYEYFKRNYAPRKGDQWLRMPDHSSRCDEYTDEERIKLLKNIQKNNKLLD